MIYSFFTLMLVSPVAAGYNTLEQSLASTLPQQPKVVVNYQPVPAENPPKNDQLSGCKDIKDNNCAMIDSYELCGFCADEKYPIKGYGCEYEEELLTVQETGGMFSSDYLVVPYCDCKGDFIFEGKDCPTCEALYQDLLKCAGAEDEQKFDDILIFQRCLEAAGKTQQDLLNCGLLHGFDFQQAEKDELNLFAADNQGNDLKARKDSMTFLPTLVTK